MGRERRLELMSREARVGVEVALVNLMLVGSEGEGGEVLVIVGVVERGRSVEGRERSAEGRVRAARVVVESAGRGGREVEGGGEAEGSDSWWVERERR